MDRTTSVGEPIRSDQSLQADACAALESDAFIDTSDIEVKVEAAVMTLSGSVTDRQEKLRAEEVVSLCMGVIDVHNELQIRKDDEDGITFTMPVLTAS